VKTDEQNHVGPKELHSKRELKVDVDDPSDLACYVDADGVDDAHGDREAHDPFSRHSEGEGV